MKKWRNGARRAVWFAVLALMGTMMAGCSLTDAMFRREVLRDRPVSIPEALQLPLDAPVYTAFNLWYETPGELDSRNYLRGKILPVGTQIVPVSATIGKLVFDDKQGQRWVLDYDAGRMMMPIEDYIREVFTLEPLEKRTGDMEPAMVEAIRAGTVVKGMTPEEVLVCYGRPAASRTPSLQNSAWIYETGPESSLRVIFRGNKVRDVLDFREE